MFIPAETCIALILMQDLISHASLYAKSRQINILFFIICPGPFVSNGSKFLILRQKKEKSVRGKQKYLIQII